MTRHMAAPRGRKLEPTTGLYTHEADISLAVRALNSVVSTLDETGALKAARDQGGKVVFMKDFDRSGLSLGDFIRSAI
jgi:hypothetical protein